MPKYIKNSVVGLVFSWNIIFSIFEVNASAKDLYSNIYEPYTNEIMIESPINNIVIVINKDMYSNAAFFKEVNSIKIGLKSRKYFKLYISTK